MSAIGSALLRRDRSRQAALAPSPPPPNPLRGLRLAPTTIVQSTIRHIALGQFGEGLKGLTFRKHLPSGTRALLRCLLEARIPHPGLARSVSSPLYLSRAARLRP